MIDNKRRAEMDQDLALVLEMLPIQWRQLYLRLIDEGFNDSEAMEWLNKYAKDATVSCKGWDAGECPLC